MMKEDPAGSGHFVDEASGISFVESDVERLKDLRQRINDEMRNEYLLERLGKEEGNFRLALFKSTLTPQDKKEYEATVKQLTSKSELTGDLQSDNSILDARIKSLIVLRETIESKTKDTLSHSEEAGKRADAAEKLNSVIQSKNNQFEQEFKVKKQAIEELMLPGKGRDTCIQGFQERCDQIKSNVLETKDISLLEGKPKHDLFSDMDTRLATETENKQVRDNAQRVMAVNSKQKGYLEEVNKQKLKCEENIETCRKVSPEGMARQIDLLAEELKNIVVPENISLEEKTKLMQQYDKINNKIESQTKQAITKLRDMGDHIQLTMLQPVHAKNPHKNEASFERTQKILLNPAENGLTYKDLEQYKAKLANLNNNGITPASPNSEECQKKTGFLKSLLKKEKPPESKPVKIDESQDPYVIKNSK